MIDGVVSEPFSATGLPPLKGDPAELNNEKVIRVSRERYARKREIVEEKITRWAQSIEPAPPPPPSPFRGQGAGGGSFRPAGPRPPYGPRHSGGNPPRQDRRPRERTHEGDITQKKNTNVSTDRESTGLSQE